MYVAVSVYRQPDNLWTADDLSFGAIITVSSPMSLHESFIIGQKELKDDGVFVYILPAGRTPRVEKEPFTYSASTMLLKKVLKKIRNRYVYNLSDLKRDDLNYLVESSDFTNDLRDLEEQYVHGLRKGEVRPPENKIEVNLSDNPQTN